MREQASSLYCVSAYFFAKVLAEIPNSLVYPVFTTLIVYWAIPFNTANSSAFGIFSIQSSLKDSPGTVPGVSVWRSLRALNRLLHH